MDRSVFDPLTGREGHDDVGDEHEYGHDADELQHDVVAFHPRVVVQAVKMVADPDADGSQHEPEDHESVPDHQPDPVSQLFNRLISPHIRFRVMRRSVDGRVHVRGDQAGQVV